MHHILKHLPPGVQASIYFRFIHNRTSKNPKLFEDAPLRYAPHIKLDLPIHTDLICGSIAYTGFYEIELTKRVVELGSIGGTMVDVGANLGYFSILWAALNPNNISYAIEAAPKNVEILKNNVSKNNLEQRVIILPYAAYNKKEVLKFVLSPEDQLGWGKIDADSTGDECTIDVDARRIEEILPQDIEQIDLMKLDIEGAELVALQGCSSYLSKKLIREIRFEQNKVAASGVNIDDRELIKYLESMGYRSRALTSLSKDVVDWVAFPE